MEEILSSKIKVLHQEESEAWNDMQWHVDRESVLDIEVVCNKIRTIRARIHELKKLQNEK